MMPFLIVLGGAIVLLAGGALVPKRIVRWAAAPFTVVVALVSMGFAFPVWHKVQHHGAFQTLHNAVGIDGFSLFFWFLIDAAVILTALFLDGYLRREDLAGQEHYVLLLLSASGGFVMAAANDLIVVFLGLEVLSIAVYVLAGSHLRRERSGEAAIKYLILGAFSSAFFLYGIALVYGATGSTNLADIADFLATNVLSSDGLLIGGILLLLVGFGFKVAAVPFHTWTPDVYQGSPTPVTAFMASGVKAAGFAGLLRVLYLAFGTYRLDWQPVIYVLAVLTLIVGAVLAVVQSDVKRILAYSSISHAGFILVGVEAATADGLSASLFYLAAYTFMVAGTFGVFTIVGRRGDGHHDISNYRGLARRQPLLALVLTILLLAQAGVPFTVGFVAKFEVLAAAARAHSYWLALVAMLSAVIAAYLYLRIVITIYAGESDEEATKPARPRFRVPLSAGIGLGLALAFTVVFGIVPDYLTQWAAHALPHVGQISKSLTHVAAGSGG
jgi:NADH-quinone oxidoreductase subunit N